MSTTNIKYENDRFVNMSGIMGASRGVRSTVVDGIRFPTEPVSCEIVTEVELPDNVKISVCKQNNTSLDETKWFRIIAGEILPAGVMSSKDHQFATIPSPICNQNSKPPHPSLNPKNKIKPWYREVLKKQSGHTLRYKV